MTHKFVTRIAEYSTSVVKKQNMQLDDPRTLLRLSMIIIETVDKNTESFSQSKKRKMCVEVLQCVCQELGLSDRLRQNGEKNIHDWFFDNTKRTCICC